MKSPFLSYVVTLLLFVSVLSVVLPATGQEEEPTELKTFRLDFQVKLSDLQKPLTDFDEKYRAYLEELKATYQEQGKLKAMLAVEEEMKAFEINLDETLAPFPELKRLQQIYREQRASKESAIAGPRLELIRNYRSRAGALASDWTKEGRIDDAKIALAEAERLGSLENDAVKAADVGRIVASGSAGSDFAGEEPGDEMENGAGMKLCWIPAGRFRMGSPDDEAEREASNEEQVRGELTSGFWMGKYEVTQDEYQDLIGSNPARFKEDGANKPVEKVSWNDAVAYCKRLTERERELGKLPEGWAYVLPTEAQWEYACRAGEKGPYSGGTLDEVGWYKDNSGDMTHAVGEKKANAWGLHDVHGNVREWCSDWLADSLAGGKDPTGPNSGSKRVHRGGHWYFGAGYARVAHRHGSGPAVSYDSLGFRVACISTPASE